MKPLEPNEQTIFDAARQMRDPDARRRYLDTACRASAVLRERVENLLLADQRADDFLARNPFGLANPTLQESTTAPSVEEVGAMIGRYKLLEKLGEGGFGAVYMAEQREPVKRRVALKIIKAGMDTREVVGRFEAERQALAMMDHPNIAKVFDAGATGNGRPYFVLELVRGIKITDYCQLNRLALEARLKLYAQVCQAVQHAHQKGIIHRDLKPSNILVTLHDGVPVPKVIDFGIAKATQQQLTEKTVFTRFHQFIGTPAYMSPEQAELSGLDIDTRSDIYSLGVLLYELLTGTTPFDGQDLLKAGLDEMRRTIREVEPLRPSTRLTGRTALAANQSQIANPTSQIPADLDWIVMKCLEKDRIRRYETANGLAADIQRHLAHEPILARPPSAAYRLQKAVRRNKAAFAATAAVLAALAIGLVVALGQYSAKNRAYQRERAEAEKARGEATKSKQIVGFLEDLLAANSPLALPGVNAAIARQALDWAAERIASELKDQPDVEAHLRMILGRAYESMQEHQKAEAMLRASLAIRRRLHGDRHPELIAPLSALSNFLRVTSRNVEAEFLIREALALHDEFAKNDENERNELLNHLGLVLLSQHDKLAEAERIFTETLARTKRLYGPTDAKMAVPLINLAGIFYRQNRFPQAAAAQREALAVVTAALAALPDGVTSPMFLDLQAAAANNLSFTLEKQGLNSEAEAARRQALDAGKKFYGAGSRQTAAATLRLGTTLSQQSRFEEADRLMTAASKEMEASGLSMRAGWSAQRGRWKEAAAGYARLVELDPDNHEHYHHLAPLLAQIGDLEAYRKHCQKETARFRDTQVPFVAERMAKDCLILPGSGADLNVVAAWTDLAVTAGKDTGFFPWFQFARGLAEYRLGHFASAAEWEEKVLGQPDQGNRDLEANAVIAMAKYRLGQTDAALAALARAEALKARMPKLEDGDIGAGWEDWIIAHLLFREARELIGGKAGLRIESRISNTGGP